MMFVNISDGGMDIIKNVNPPNTLYSFLLHPIRNKKYLLRKKGSRTDGCPFFMPFFTGYIRNCDVHTGDSVFVVEFIQNLKYNINI